MQIESCSWEQHITNHSVCRKSRSTRIIIRWSFDRLLGQGDAMLQHSVDGRLRVRQVPAGGLQQPTHLRLNRLDCGHKNPMANQRLGFSLHVLLFFWDAGLLRQYWQKNGKVGCWKRQIGCSVCVWGLFVQQIYAGLPSWQESASLCWRACNCRGDIL